MVTHLLAAFGGSLITAVSGYFFCFVDWDRNDNKEKEEGHVPRI